MLHACIHRYMYGALNMHVLYMLKIIVPLLVRTYMYAKIILYYSIIIIMKL